MQIDYVIDSLALGGAQKDLRQIVTGMAARGHRQHVICLNDICHPAVAQPMRDAGAEVTVIGRSAIQQGRGLLRLYRLLRQDRPEVVVTMLFVSTVLGRLAARLARVPRIVTCVLARNINFTAWQFAALRATAPLTDHFVFNALSAKSFAAAREGMRLQSSVYIPNGISPTEAATARTAGARQAKDLPFGDDCWIIGAVGRLDPQKGFDLLIRAFGRIAPAHPRARLVIVGAGGAEQELRLLARQAVPAGRMHFAGERADVPELLPLFDVYAQPSRFEGTPNALMEAMAAGLPVVATAVDGHLDLIPSGEVGRLVPADNVARLEAALAELAADLSSSAALGQAARRSVLERYPLDTMIKRYASVLESTARKISDRDTAPG